MPQFSAGQVRLESGVIGSSTMQPIERVTNVRVGSSLSRANTNVLNRGKPLQQRPVINYTPVDASIDFFKSDNRLEQCLGLINTTGITAALTNTRAGATSPAVRSMQIAYAPTDSASFNGLYDLKSGVLTSYSLQGGVSEPVRGSVSFQFLDGSGSVYNTSRTSSNYDANLVKPENQLITGLGSDNSLLLTGFGITGVTVQSFSFSAGFNRAAVMQLGRRFPIERPLTDANASFEVRGYFEGLNNSFTGFNSFNCGDPTFGIIALIMTPSCSNGGSSKITLKNPYFDGLSVDSQAGGFSTFAMTFSLPLGPNPLENTDGSSVVLS